MLPDISDLVSPDLIAVDVPATTRKALFAQVGALAGAALPLDPRVVAEALAAREKAGSTGFGGGVAVPHARIDGLSRIVAIVVRLSRPIDFDAVDGAGVDVVIALLTPTEAGAEHLKALARVSRRLRDRDFLAKLRGAGSPDAVYVLLTADETRDAA